MESSVSVSFFFKSHVQLNDWFVTPRPQSYDGRPARGCPRWPVDLSLAVKLELHASLTTNNAPWQLVTNLEKVYQTIL